MTTITAKIVADSIGDHAPRLTTMLLRYPRCIHDEFMTHRVFSRNASSSRAIPVSKLIQDIVDDPAVPLYWGKNQKGMRAGEELSDREQRDAKMFWEQGMNSAILVAQKLHGLGCHKQIVNRVLEPYSHITVVITGSHWSNFDALRDHPDAEPHIQLLAQAIKKARAEADVQTLEVGEWHLPFVNVTDGDGVSTGLSGGEALENTIKLSVARCASTSYKTVEGFDMTLERAIALHDKLVASVPLHASPCEHQAKADEKIPGAIGPYGEWRTERWRDGRCGNLGLGWVQYRKLLPGECQ